MDRMVEPLDGFYPTHPEWAWLHESIGLCPDPTSSDFRDMGEWAHYPEVPSASVSVSQALNGFGPAILCPNTNDGVAWSQGIVFNPGTSRRVLSSPAWAGWTIAIGFARHAYVAGLTTASRIYRSGANWRVDIHGSNGNVNWNVNNGGSILSTPAGVIDAVAYGPTQTVVVTTHIGNGTHIYANGRLVASAAWGHQLAGFTLWYVGHDLNKKMNAILGAAYGPVVLGRTAWTAAQVAQWDADPWGFRRPAVHPIPYSIDALSFDTRTRRAVDFDVRTKRASDFDTRTRRAVDFDARTRRAVDFDVRTRRAVDFDVRTQPKGD
jgi:hypothetical protein